MDAYIDGIRRVTREAVQKAARQYLDRDRRTVGVMIPAAGNSR